MKYSQTLLLVGSAVRAANSVVTKSASASPQQAEVLSKGWPRGDENISKKAALARMLATGLMVEEAEASRAPAPA